MRFNLEQFKNGRRAKTRDGETIRFIAYVPEANEDWRLVAFNETTKEVQSYAEDGRVYVGEENSSDLIAMDPKIVELWAVYDPTGKFRSGFDSEYAARQYYPDLWFQIVRLTGEAA